MRAERCGRERQTPDPQTRLPSPGGNPRRQLFIEEATLSPSWRRRRQLNILPRYGWGPGAGAGSPASERETPGRVGGLPDGRAAGVGAGAGSGRANASGRQTGAGSERWAARGRAGERSAGLDELPCGRRRAGAVGSGGGSQGRGPLRAVTAPRPALGLSLLTSPSTRGRRGAAHSPWSGRDTRGGQRGAGLGLP